jgi:hypothetical protein
MGREENVIKVRATDMSRREWKRGCGRRDEGDEMKRRMKEEIKKIILWHGMTCGVTV